MKLRPFVLSSAVLLGGALAIGIGERTVNPRPDSEVYISGTQHKFEKRGFFGRTTFVRGITYQPVWNGTNFVAKPSVYEIAKKTRAFGTGVEVRRGDYKGPVDSIKIQTVFPTRVYLLNRVVDGENFKSKFEEAENFLENVKKEVRYTASKLPTIE